MQVKVQDNLKILYSLEEILQKGYKIATSIPKERKCSYCNKVLKPKGIFITQQVGAENDRELVELLLNEIPPLPFPKQYLHKVQQAFEKKGFTTLEAEEVYRPIKFWNVGALVWFAHIIEWEFPNFDVKKCLLNLYHAQEVLEKNGVIEGRIHRFLYVAQK